MYVSEVDVKVTTFSTKQEDLIWAIRQSSEKKTQRNSILYEPNIQQYHKDAPIKLMASLVPNEVILNVNDYTPKEFNGCLLSGVIEGWSKLLDIYYEPSKGGRPIKFSKIMSEYFSGIIEEIMGFNGDVLILLGEYFLALWKSADESTPNYEVHTAINCALELQKYSFEADGVKIRMKLAITAGRLVFSLIGDEESSSYVSVGKPMDDILEAQQKCAVDEIIVTPSAWMYVNLAEYLSVETEDGAHIKVLGIGPNWHVTGKDYLIRSETQELTRSESRPYLMEEETDSDSIDHANSGLYLRPLIRYALHLREELQRFVPSPVMQLLEADGEIELLNEMRHLVVMFVNIVAKKRNLNANVDIIDQCYKTVFNIAKEHKGIIMRIAQYNKDIKFVIIFGLPGSTNVSESRQALSCSMKCQRYLNLIADVQAISISCTSGICHCGLFGHSVRRNYAVMSTTIHKAVQMIATYPDRITCDRKIFLDSQLESSNFILMDYRRLEEIKQQGLIYEYKAEEQMDLSGSIFKFALNNRTICPILGRDNEVTYFRRTFRSFLENYGHCDTKNAIVIEADRKQGKTRLLDEFIYMAKGTKCCEIALRNDKTNDFRGLRAILEPFLKPEKHQLQDHRKQLIEESMGNASDKFLCCLNEVFCVNFPTNKEYENLTADQKREELKTRIQHICRWCFKEPILISIDNADWMDQESWALLPAMLQTKKFFLVAVINERKGRASKYRSFLKATEVSCMSVKKIPTIYQASIACQILGVYALPADLENAIQSNSNGNPGWIENFIVTLLHSKKIFIKSLKFKDIYEIGLVMPPLYMLKRLTPGQISRYKSLLEEKTAKFGNAAKLDQWHLYVDSCRDEHTDVDVRQRVQEILCNDDTEVRACLMNDTFNVALDVDPEVSDDMNILELYDAMSYQEQLMLKIASVLGDLFTRRVLCFVWGPRDELEAATVIQSMFEKGVLCCARADFSGGGDYVLQRDKMTDPSKDKKIQCRCIGMDIDDSCLNLPTYASCVYMRFRTYKFRKLIYDRMPDITKKDFHCKAAKYIEKDTRRCASCGFVFFLKEGICRLDQSPVNQSAKNKNKKKKPVQLQQMNFEELFDYSTNQNVRSMGGSTLSKETRQSVFQSYRASTVRKSEFPSFTGLGVVMEEHKSPYSKLPNIISPLRIIRLKDCVSLIRTFSKSNFESCECHLILGHMHKRLKHHYKHSGQWSKMIKSCINLVKLCVFDKNYTTAVKTISEAFKVLDNKVFVEKEPSWKIKMYRGMLLALKGKVLLCLDQVDEAYRTFLETMKAFNFPFPVNKLKLKFHLKLFKEKWKQKMNLYFFPEFIAENGDENEFEVMNSMSDTLCQLCRIYIARKEWKLAELAAIWSLRNSLITEISLVTICESFELMIAIAHHNRNKLLSMSLEFHALRYCHKKQYYVDSMELKAVVRLYYQIFESRVGRAELSSALHIGYITLNIASTSNELETAVRVLSLLPIILLRTMRMRETISMLHELEFFASELDNCWGTMWYYALAVLFHIDTGYTFVPFHNIQNYYTLEGANLVPEFKFPKMLWIISMWLWYLRNGRWEAASVFNKDIDKFRKIEANDTLHAWALIFILEGSLLILVNKIDKRNIYGKTKMKREVRRILKVLRKAKHFALSIACRLYLLEAYHSLIMNEEERMKKMLKKSRKFAMKYNSDLGIVHLDHCEKAWNKEISTPLIDFWKNHCSRINFISYADIDFDNLKIYPYTYPTPIYKT